MRKLIIILLIALTLPNAVVGQWVESDSTKGFYVSLEYDKLAESFFVLFDIAGMTAKLNQYTVIELTMTSGDVWPYHFKPEQVVDMRQEILYLPVSTSTFLAIMANGAIDNLRIDSGYFALSDKDRARVSRTLKGGL